MAAEAVVLKQATDVKQSELDSVLSQLQESSDELVAMRMTMQLMQYEGGVEDYAQVGSGCKYLQATLLMACNAI